MLAVSSLRNFNDEDQGQIESFSMDANDFPDFSGGNLLDSIDFDDLFEGINDGDVSPDLEMDPEILAEFSVSEGEESSMNASKSREKLEDDTKKEDEDKVLVSGSGLNSSSSQGEESVSKRDESDVVKGPPNEAGKGRRSSSRSKKSQGKRKVKVDWTPELHRCFVQAVEQLGAEKAVPSRILEVMGVDGLTRHNIASHLQKYRSHRKHLLKCKAEAASWTQGRQIYGAAPVGGGMIAMSPWLAPTMGFPPPVTPMHHFRPLHVWGHPSMDQIYPPMWPNYLVHSLPPPPLTPAATLAPAPLPTADLSYWRPNHHRRLASALAPAIPPHAMFEVDTGVGVPPRQPSPHPLLDIHPTEESVDAAIADVLSKPRLPFPIGLKAPSPESVTEELQRLGIRKMPPSSA